MRRAIITFVGASVVGRPFRLPYHSIPSISLSTPSPRSTLTMTAPRRRSACAQCPSIAPCINCASPGQSCQQIFRPSGECATCPTNICVGSPSPSSTGVAPATNSPSSANANADSGGGGGGGTSPGAIVGPVTAVGGTLLVAAIFIVFWWKRRKTKRATRARLREDAKLRDAKARQFTVGGGGPGSASSHHSGRSPSVAGGATPGADGRGVETEWTELRTDGLQAYQAHHYQEHQDSSLPYLPHRRNSTGAATHLSRITEGQEDAGGEDARSSASAAHRYSQLSRRSGRSGGNPFETFAEGNDWRGTGTPEVPPLPPLVHRALGAPLDGLQQAQDRNSMQRVPLRGGDYSLDLSVQDASEDKRQSAASAKHRSTWRLSAGGGVGREPYSPAAPSTARSRHFDRDDLEPPPPLPEVSPAVQEASAKTTSPGGTGTYYHSVPRIVTLATPTTSAPSSYGSTPHPLQEQQSADRSDDPFSDGRAVKRPSSAQHRRGSYSHVGSQDSQGTTTTGSQDSTHGDGEGQSFMSGTASRQQEDEEDEIDNRSGGRSLAGETFGRRGPSRSSTTTSSTTNPDPSYVSLPPLPSLPPLSSSSTGSPAGQEIITFAQPGGSSAATVTPQSGLTAAMENAMSAWESPLHRSDTTTTARSGVTIPIVHEGSSTQGGNSANAATSASTARGTTAPSSYKFGSSPRDADEEETGGVWSRPPSNWRGSRAAGEGSASRNNSGRRKQAQPQQDGEATRQRTRSTASSIGGLSVLDGFDFRVSEEGREREEVPPLPVMSAAHQQQGGGRG